MVKHRSGKKTRRAPKRYSTAVAMGVGLMMLMTGAGAGSATPASGCIPIEDGDGCLPVAPERDRVDLAEPEFSNPTAITNALFPIGELTQVIQLGVDGGETLRVEITRMPGTKTIAWNGQEIETVVAQFVASLDGRVAEVAYDFYAQADDGAVWYFGEDVFNYEDGELADTGGTWLAGKDGPPGMIMPADPEVGDVYRPENIPGFVFEEVTVRSITETVAGPHGAVEGAIVNRERQMDGKEEDKTFAPGYGEFSAAVGTEFVVVALGVPRDTLAGGVPTGLAAVSVAAADLVGAIVGEDWDAIAETVAVISTIWESEQVGVAPPVLAAQLDVAVESLVESVEAESAADARHAAVAVGQASLYLQLQYRDPAAVDLDRLRLWADRLVLDAEGNDAAAVLSDVVIVEAIWDRVAHTADAAAVEAIAAGIGTLRTAAATADFEAVIGAAGELRDLVGAVRTAT